MKVRITTQKEDRTTYHSIDGVNMECSGMDCPICNSGERELKEIWELSVPAPFPPKGKRYKNKLKQSIRGKTIREICYTCKEIPCYICKRTECSFWMKEENRKGQEIGCSFWEDEFCSKIVCLKGIIKTSWKDLKTKEET